MQQALGCRSVGVTWALPAGQPPRIAARRARMRRTAPAAQSRLAASAGWHEASKAAHRLPVELDQLGGHLLRWRGMPLRRGANAGLPREPRQRSRRRPPCRLLGEFIRRGVRGQRRRVVLARRDAARPPPFGSALAERLNATVRRADRLQQQCDCAAFTSMRRRRLMLRLRPPAGNHPAHIHHPPVWLRCIDGRQRWTRPLQAGRVSTRACGGTRPIVQGHNVRLWG
eukprot:scaffold31794_cov107-Isochrysis_galbana.AAC.10